MKKSTKHLPRESLGDLYNSVIMDGPFGSEMKQQNLYMKS